MCEIKGERSGERHYASPQWGLWFSPRKCPIVDYHKLMNFKLNDIDSNCKVMKSMVYSIANLRVLCLITKTQTLRIICCLSMS